MLKNYKSFTIRATIELTEHVKPKRIPLIISSFRKNQKGRNCDGTLYRR